MLTLVRVYGKLALMAHAGNDGPDQPANSCSLFRPFIAPLQNECGSTNNEGPDQNTWICRLLKGPFPHVTQHILTTRGIACAPREDSGQSSQPRSLIRVFAGHSMDSQGAKASNSRQRRLILIFAGLTCNLVGNAMPRVNLNYESWRKCQNCHFKIFIVVKSVNPFTIQTEAFPSLFIIEPKREKTHLLTCAPNEDSDQPALPLSLICLRCPH